MLLFIILVVATLFFMHQIGKMLNSVPANTMPNEMGENSYPCDNPPPGKAAGHKWVLKYADGRSDHTGYLICQKCKREPGSLE